ncbi:MAG: hypothetical protein KME15_19360 [Drouetiella hepatica Uher 2000/2452]|jgi:VIT1/CCC1 family predicted Fe2+/Mn2+ transporter|uniref:Uncharacterized protein n=1 Tax=Drouetiella hepatica Uher 2000/2452 TaxID=904376 RepID=A0A951QDP9_9CYAN|nr:hypothetical protein [Drouetiella hepatica Uher 2000/2452]
MLSPFVNLNSSALLLTLLTLHCVMGILAAIVAQRKGKSFRQWLIWGLIGGTPTLLIAIFRPDPAPPPAK